MEQRPPFDENDPDRREMSPDDFDEETENAKPEKLLESDHTQDPDDIDAGWGEEEPEADVG